MRSLLQQKKMKTFFTTEQAFFYHWKEIKWRSFYLFGTLGFNLLCSSYQLSSVLFLLTRPFLEKKIGPFIYTEIWEFWVTLLNLAVFLSVLLVFPLILYHFWTFLNPSLYQFEARIWQVFYQSFFILYVGVPVMTYSFFLPFALDFFLAPQFGKGTLTGPLLECQARISSYLLFCQTLIEVTFFLFFVPFLLIVLISFGWVSSLFLTKMRWFFYVFFCANAAFFAPPDPIIQFSITLAGILFYEWSLFLSFFQENRTKRQ